MKNKCKLFGFAAVIAAIILCFPACSDGSNDTLKNVPVNPNPADSDPVSVSGVSLDKTNISLVVGSTANLSATVAPDNATNKAVTWSSSDTTKATVSNGVVIAVAEGTATIKVTTADGGKTASCTVTITDGSTTPTFAITMQNDGNGTATASPNPAEQGAEVTITATRNPGYSFENWQVVSGGITLSHNGANPAKFTMPGNAVTIKATFALIPPDTPALSLAPPTFDDVTIGYAAQSAKNVTITNEGTGIANITSIALDSDGNTAFTLDGTSITTVAVGGTATFTVQPKIGLAVGTYEGTITVTYDLGKKAEAEVSFTVTNTTFNVTNDTEWNAAISVINDGGNDKTYDINVTGNFSIPGYSYPTFNVTTVNIRGAGTISLTAGSTGSLLYIGTNQTVNFKDTHLKGHSTNTTSLVYVDNGTFNMTGGTISDNTNTNTYEGGGGVYVTRSGTFNMSGTAVINGNKAQNGGGVYLIVNFSYATATFNMTGGTISNNASTSANKGGGGIYAATSGSTYGNTNIIINITGGTISGNSTADANGTFGGGIYLDGASTLTMSGGTISGNSAWSGGGVGISNLGNYITFTMTGGIITGNNATLGTSGTNLGGGVFAQGGTFNLGSLDFITGNTALGTSPAPSNQVLLSNGTLLINGSTPPDSLKVGSSGTLYAW